jgi:hypothetical protein
VQAFEYLVQLVSILVGLALADLAMSLHRLVRAGGRVRWHWHAPATGLLLVLLMLDIWWGMRLLERAQVSWTIGLFLPMLFGLLGFFLLAAAALPDDVPSDGLDLQAYYLATGRYFWSLFAGVTLLFTAHTMAVSWLALDHPDPSRLALRFAPNFGVALLAASLAAFRHSWWHSLVIICLIAVMLSSYLARPLA